MIAVFIYLMREREDERERERQTGSTHLSPEELSCTFLASWLRWPQDAPWQPDTPWARPTCPFCWGRRGPSSRPSARWLFAGYLRRCSHLLVIGMHQAFLCNRTVIDLVDRSAVLPTAQTRFSFPQPGCTRFRLHARYVPCARELSL